MIDNLLFNVKNIIILPISIIHCIGPLSFNGKQNQFVMVAQYLGWPRVIYQEE